MSLGMPLLLLLLVAALVSTICVGRWPMAQSMGIWLCFVLLGMTVATRDRILEEQPPRSELSLRWQNLKQRALERREVLQQRMGQNRDNSDELGVLAAMTLGDKRAVSREVRQTYSQTGASHVLALSGLHLGIIYLLLTRIMPSSRRWRWLTRLLVVLGIWAFALLTGLSNSVVRAATMLTVYTIAALGGRDHSPLNVLAFTAIVMLLADSQSLFDIGFQLSFMAMLGILLFIPLLQRMKSQEWKASHPYRYQLVSLLAVSVAAQLGTAPLVAYYFGQFATYFLLTNLVVIPAATLILYGALLVLIFPILSPALLWIVGMLNTLLSWIATLPGASISHLHPSIAQVVASYVLIATVYVLLAKYGPKQ